MIHFKSDEARSPCIANTVHLQEKDNDLTNHSTLESNRSPYHNYQFIRHSSSRRSQKTRGCSWIIDLNTAHLPTHGACWGPRRSRCWWGSSWIIDWQSAHPRAQAAALFSKNQKDGGPFFALEQFEKSQRTREVGSSEGTQLNAYRRTLIKVRHSSRGWGCEGDFHKGESLSIVKPPKSVQHTNYPLIATLSVTTALYTKAERNLGKLFETHQRSLLFFFFSYTENVDEGGQLLRVPSLCWRYCSLTPIVIPAGMKDSV